MNRLAVRQQEFNSLTPWREGIELLLPYCKSVHCVPAKSQRAVSPQVLKNHLKQNKQLSINAQIEAYDRLDDCLHQLNEPSKHPMLVTGSFYLVGNALSIIDDGEGISHKVKGSRNKHGMF